MDELSEIQDWYVSMCDGDWEHQFGLKTDTLDNPGWIVKIDIAETDLETKPFTPVEKGVGTEAIEGDQDWYECEKKDKKFIGNGGPFHLKTILRIFLNWKNS